MHEILLYERHLKICDEICLASAEICLLHHSCRGYLQIPQLWTLCRCWTCDSLLLIQLLLALHAGIISYDDWSCISCLWNASTIIMETFFCLGVCWVLFLAMAINFCVLTKSLIRCMLVNWFASFLISIGCLHTETGQKICLSLLLNVCWVEKESNTMKNAITPHIYYFYLEDCNPISPHHYSCLQDCRSP